MLAARGSEDAGGLLSHDQRLAEQEPEEMRRQQEHITAEEAVELARFSVKEIDHLQRKESINVAICVRQVKSREGGDTDGNAGGGLEKHDVSDEVAAYGKEEGGDRPEALEQDEWKKKYPSSAGIPSLRLSLFNGSVDSLILSYRNMEHDSEKEIDSISASFKDGLQGGQEYDAGGHGSVRKDKPPRHIASCAGVLQPQQNKSLLLYVRSCANRSLQKYWGRGMETFMTNPFCNDAKCVTSGTIFIVPPTRHAR